MTGCGIIIDGGKKKRRGLPQGRPLWGTVVEKRTLLKSFQPVQQLLDGFMVVVNHGFTVIFSKQGP